MIEAKLLTHLGQFQLTADISSSGTICLAGRNGSGKTTLLKAIGGFLQVDEGYVRIGGADVTGLPIEKRGAVMVTPSTYFAHLDVDSHLTWGARLTHMKVEGTKVSEVKAALGIDYGGPVGKLSVGMRERVTLATALLAAPKLILVDEAFSNLHQREEFIARYGQLVKDTGADLIFTTQDATDGTLADHLYLMDNGSTSQPDQTGATSRS
jgi:molybdate/tungstate transport system ATP-binding protein